MLFVQGRGDITVLPAVTALLLHHNAMDTGIDCSVFGKGKGDFMFLPAVKKFVLLHSAMDTGTDGNFVSTGKGGIYGCVCSNESTFTSECY